MKIIYVSTLCSDIKFHELFSLSKTKPVQQGQKYTKLLVSGISKNNIELHVLSAYPINRKNTKKVFFKNSTEIDKKIEYRYLGFINMGFLKNISVFFNSIYSLTKLLEKNNDSIVIVDGLNVTLSLATAIVCKIKKNKMFTTVTDIPSHLHETLLTQKLSVLRNKIINMIFDYVTSNSNGFIFLTKYMEKIKKDSSQNSIVIEGIADQNMKNKINNLNNKYKEKVCMYTGALSEIYGIKLLVEGFIKADVDNSELHLYGSGDCDTYLSQLSKRNNKIKYFGVVENNIIVEEQLKATLLINPRPSDREYTKYSFPSKNMEYMASGTPILSTRLPGMPEEYFDFIYLIQSETIDGIAVDIKNILVKDKEELHKKGLQAKEFVLNEKNSIVQGSRLIEMVMK